MIIFLSKVLHGDLAARNVLLADDGVVKVADLAFPVDCITMNSI